MGSEQTARVLVVDDDPMAVEMISTALQNAGYEVTKAFDAWQAVSQVQGLKIGLVICDIMMPGGYTGADVVKKLRCLPGVSAQLPIIFITGIDLAKALKMISWDPKMRLITKPISFEALRSAIRELTGVDRPL